MLQVFEVVQYGCQYKVQGMQFENGENIGGKDQEGVSCNGKNGRDVVEGEYDVCCFYYYKCNE